MNVLRSPIYSPTRSPTRSPLTRIKGGGFSPTAFLATYPTIRWWSPRQLEQADGSAISQVNDLSSNADHLVQATTAANPTFSITQGVGRAVFDSGDRLALAGSAVLGIGTVTKMTIFAAIRHTNSTAAVVCEGGNPTLANGGWGLYINNGTSGAIGASVGTGNGTSNTAYNFRDSNGAGAVPRSYVVAATINTALSAADEIAIVVDGISQTTVSAASFGTVTGNIPAAAAAFIVGGRTSSAPFTSELFDLAIAPGEVSASDIVAFSRHLFNECGF